MQPFASRQRVTACIQRHREFGNGSKLGDYNSIAQMRKQNEQRDCLNTAQVQPSRSRSLFTPSRLV
jgi:hypothetical protein